MPEVEEMVEFHTYDSLTVKDSSILLIEEGNQNEEVYVANDIVKTNTATSILFTMTFCQS